MNMEVWNPLLPIMKHSYTHMPSFTDILRAMHHRMHELTLIYMIYKLSESQHQTLSSFINNNYGAMAIQNHEETRLAKKKKYLERRSSRMVSFSAKLPDDVAASFQDRCVCAVKYSRNPLREVRESIVEMIEKMGIREWREMEELIYCYLALNSSHLHHLIQEAFLSLRFSTPTFSHTL